MGVTSNGLLPIGKIIGVCLEPNRSTLFCWIRIRIEMKGRIQIQIRTEAKSIPHRIRVRKKSQIRDMQKLDKLNLSLNLDTHLNEKSDPGLDTNLFQKEKFGSRFV
jgi:hypothetical protein